MSYVKEFYLTKFSKCPKCGGKLEHLSVDKLTKGFGANFDCEDCKQRFDFSDYIKIAIMKMDRKQLLQIFDRCYCEVNK